MKKLKPYLKYFKNFYLVVGVVAMVWMLFFDQYNVLARIDTQFRIRQLEEDLDYYKVEKERFQEEWTVLETDMDEIERYGREQHRMKKPNEDLFILVDE